MLESPTASGKTLAFTIPMFDMLLTDRNSYAMIIHPMKALTNDQRRQVTDLAKLMTEGRRIESWPYDGDTLEHERKALRERPPSIIFTNPEMIHLSFLGHSNLWLQFLKNLRYIVIDEIHEYRGFFGTNLSLLLRRFLLKLNRLGVNPQLFLTTATCNNPLEHARNLTGQDFKLIQAREKMSPHRVFLFINPQIPDYYFYNIFKLRIAKAAITCLIMDLSTLIFCPSRKFTEEVWRKTKREAEEIGLDFSQIIPYRSGYSPEQRRNIEEGLREGKYKVVFSTNALELGIDIGKLDVCILAGFPDNVMSAWQRIGRVGRDWDKTAYCLYYAFNNAYDQFYAENIDIFLNKPLDEIFIGNNNDELIIKHIPFLLHECEWNINDNNKNILGQTFYDHALYTFHDPSEKYDPIIHGWVKIQSFL